MSESRDHIAKRPTLRLARLRASRDGAGTRHALVFEFTEDIAPESVLHLVTGLRKHFPKTTFWIGTDAQLRVFARESDDERIRWMRAFCAGFVASL